MTTSDPLREHPPASELQDATFEVLDRLSIRTGCETALNRAADLELRRRGYRFDTKQQRWVGAGVEQAAPVLPSEPSFFKDWNAELYRVLGVRTQGDALTRLRDLQAAEAQLVASDAARLVLQQQLDALRVSFDHSVLAYEQNKLQKAEAQLAQKDADVKDAFASCEASIDLHWRPKLVAAEAQLAATEQARDELLIKLDFCSCGHRRATHHIWGQCHGWRCKCTGFILAEDESAIQRADARLQQLRAALTTFHRYTITSEGASKGYFRLVEEDPAGAWVQWPELQALLDAAEEPSK